MEIVKKNYNTTRLVTKNKVTWTEFDAFSNLPIKHAYSTRLGGVSSGVCSSMNLRNCEWDTLKNYKKNMQLFCEACGFPFERIVATHQTHTTNVFVVTEENVPTGTLFERQFNDIDALVTNVPEVVLTASFADCIPIFLYDTKNHAIGLGHAGWRGCLGRIGKNMLEAMRASYGTDPGDIEACVGPGICFDCYEVGCELYEKFSDRFTKAEMSVIFKKTSPAKYHLDLWKANSFVLSDAGVPEERIHLADICTRCNPQLYFSHRVMGNARGNQCGFLMLK